MKVFALRILSVTVIAFVTLCVRDALLALTAECPAGLPSSGLYAVWLILWLGLAFPLSQMPPSAAVLVGLAAPVLFFFPFSLVWLAAYWYVEMPIGVLTALLIRVAVVR